LPITTGTMHATTQPSPASTAPREGDHFDGDLVELATWHRHMTEPDARASDNSHDARLLQEFATAFSGIESTREFGPDPQLRRLAYLACADLLDYHDDVSIDLCDWQTVKALVEYCIGHEIHANKA
jgi:hypothetical protein